MFRFFRFICLTLLSCLLIAAQAASASSEGSLTRQLAAMKYSKDLILNSAELTKNPLVYYVYHINLPSGVRTFNHVVFRERTEFFEEVCNTIRPKGAELILHLEYTAADAERLARYKQGGHYDYLADLPSLAGRSKLKCPIVNASQFTVRRALFPNRSHEQGTDRFRALDADGQVLAYFSRINNTIYMYDRNMKNRVALTSSIPAGTAWEVTAIMTSYNKLLQKVRNRELINRHKANVERAEQSKREESRKKKAEKSKKKKAAKKSSGGKSKFKAVRKRGSRDDDDGSWDEDEWSDEDDDEEEEDDEEDDDKDDDEDDEDVDSWDNWDEY